MTKTITNLRPVSNEVDEDNSSNKGWINPLHEHGIISRGGASQREVDAFRELRTRLRQMIPGSFVGLVVPVSSRSGGPFVARNLAAALAFEEARQSLLIDCNLRHPSQHSSVGLNPNYPGLADFLDAAKLSLSELIHATSAPGMTLMPAGGVRQNSTESLGSARMRLLIDSLRSADSARTIILDAPPALESPDARVLAAVSDLIVLVAGYGVDVPAAIARAAESLPAAKFAGVVFNEAT